MSCCDTLSEKYNQLNYDYVELMSKELDLQIEIGRLQSELKDAEDLLEANEYDKCKKCGMWLRWDCVIVSCGCEQ